MTNKQGFQHTMNRILTVCCLSLSITACQTPNIAGDTASLTPAITTVTLNQEFPIRPDRTNEYIQNGEITLFEHISEYEPFCKLELRALADVARVIQPDSFSVSRIVQETEFAGFRKMMLAGDGSSGLIMSTTYLYLQSEKQPEIFRLSCMRLDMSFYARHVSVNEMSDTLGSMFTLSTPAGD
jgi:hypothetical protein